LSASLAFAFNNYFIKKFKMDFTDVLLVRATCQILIFGLFSKLGGYIFYPDFSSDEEPRKWKIIKSFLLLLQVITRYPTVRYPTVMYATVRYTMLCYTNLRYTTLP
jgi:hypothetical protein